MTGGIYTAYRGELFKLLAQKRTWLGFATATIGPIIYLMLELAQGPPDAQDRPDTFADAQRAAAR